LRVSAAAQLVLLDLEPVLEDLLRLVPSDGDIHGNLLVSSDAESADGVARRLRELLEGDLRSALGNSEVPKSIKNW
jgi:hypothetical protein